MLYFCKGKNSYKNYKLMKEKERYFSPEIEVIQMRSEGVICVSGTTDEFGTGELPGFSFETITSTSF